MESEQISKDSNWAKIKDLYDNLPYSSNRFASQLIYAVSNTLKMYDKNPLHNNDSIHELQK